MSVTPTWPLRVRRAFPASSRSPRRVRRQGLSLPLLASALAAVLGTTVVQPASATSLRSHRDRTPPVIAVDASRRGDRVHAGIMGVNHRWFHDGQGLWDLSTDAPNPTMVRLARKAGISSLRYPGGTVATMFNWKHAVGQARGCQTDAKFATNHPLSAVRGAKAYGPSEYMQVSRAIGSQPLIMAPFVNETPSDAADWVEYMNSRVGANPNGGFDWATVRAADGHRAPYHVRLWEVGNESHVAPTRYGFSANPYRAVRQYANGGVRHVSDEALGKGCDHRPDGRPSDGSRNQVFTTLFKPFQRPGFSLSVDGQAWQRVKDLSQAGPNDLVYAVRPTEGEVVFGDGRHGAIPPAGTLVTATYQTKFQGFFSFARRMKAVDPTIDVCASWGKSAFARVAGDRRYDCLTAHPITNFGRRRSDNWRTALMGHDRMMLGLESRQEDITQLQRSLPSRSRLLVTEFNAINGDFQAFHAWSASASHAVYMASMCAILLKSGVPLAEGGDFVNPRGEGAVIGPSPAYTFSADATMRQAISPMFTAGGRVLFAKVRHGPRRTPSLRAPELSYPGLSVAATKSGSQMWVLVVNQLPSTAVRARVELAGFRSRRTAIVRRVESSDFTDWNRAGHRPSVQLSTGHRTVGQSGFGARFPAHSITLYRLNRS